MYVNKFPKILGREIDNSKNQLEMLLAPLVLQLIIDFWVKIMNRDGLSFKNSDFSEKKLSNG